jgi:hypothetical protein
VISILVQLLLDRLRILHSTNVGPPMSVPTSVHMASKSCSSFVRGTFFQCIERSGTSNVAKKPEDFELPKYQKSSLLNDLIEVIKFFHQLFAEARWKQCIEVNESIIQSGNIFLEKN